MGLYLIIKARFPAVLPFASVRMPALARMLSISVVGPAVSIGGNLEMEVVKKAHRTVRTSSSSRGESLRLLNPAALKFGTQPSASRLH